MISIIAAFDENFGIGINNTLPWHLPNDLKWFKKHTNGEPIVMGRKTFESIGRPLPNRQNIVLSRSVQEIEGVTVIDNIDDIVSLSDNDNNIFIIGGSEIFKYFINVADILYLTRVHTKIEGTDTFFPNDFENKFNLVFSEKNSIDEKHQFAYTFEIWKNIS